VHEEHEQHGREIPREPAEGLEALLARDLRDQAEDAVGRELHQDEDELHDDDVRALEEPQQRRRRLPREGHRDAEQDREDDDLERAALGEGLERIGRQDLDQRLGEARGLGELRAGRRRRQLESRARLDQERRHDRQADRDCRRAEVEAEGLAADPAELRHVVEGGRSARQRDQDQRYHQQLEARQEDLSADREDAADEEVGDRVALGELTEQQAREGPGDQPDQDPACQPARIVPVPLAGLRFNGARAHALPSSGAQHTRSSSGCRAAFACSSALLGSADAEISIHRWGSGSEGSNETARDPSRVMRERQENDERQGRKAMRTRPARSGDSIRLSARRGWMATAAALSLCSLLGAGTAAAAWDGSAAQKAVATGVDLTIVRPLAAVRAGIGSMLLVPASILASPACAVNLVRGESCRPVYEAAYEVLVGEPADYAFNREMGEL
jgi:hypothetical protein